LPQHIGIVACTAEVATLGYFTICTESTTPHPHPQNAFHAYARADNMVCINCDDWPAVSQGMLASARKLVCMVLTS
jgi:aspartate racemase